MPKYSYIVRDAYGKKTKGEAAAVDEIELSEQLFKDGMYMLSCKELSKEVKRKALRSKELSEFCRQMGTLVASGVTLVRALGIMQEEEGIKPYQRQIYRELNRRIRQGTPMSDAMQELEGVFPPLLIHMMHTAEVAGNLDKTCLRMAEQYEKEYKLASKVNSAMTYPKILTVLIIAVVAVIMTFVMPQFTELFAQMESLPAPTQFLMDISDFVRQDWLVCIIAVFIFILVYKLLMRIPAICVKKDELIVHMPVFGKLQKAIYTARFARTLCSLYGSGLPIISALAIARHTTGNVYIDMQFDEVIAFVRAGGTLSEGLEQIDGFTKKLIASIKIGEETGHLEYMLESTADNLDYEAEMAINKMVAMIEPMMLIVMACVVGFVMVSVMMPIYNSYGSISDSSGY